MGRLGQRLKFRLEQLFVRGARFQLLAVAALIGLISVVGGALVAAGGGSEFGSLGDAIWWAFLRLSDPGYLGDDEGAVRRTVSTILTVLGYVVFLGALVAIMTQWLSATMRRLESGLTPIARDDHLLILGWTGRTGTIVRELVLSEGRVRRFLQRHGARQLHIVILAEEVSAALGQELKDRLGDAWNPRQITLRSGSPLRSDHLGRVDFSHSLAILIPAAEFGDRGPETADTRTIKTLLSISNHPGVGRGTALPLAVAEIFDQRKVAVAEQAYAGPVEILASDAVVSRLIAQNVRHRGLSHVYNELLTHSAGNEIYVRTCGHHAGRPARSLLGRFPEAVPLGLVRPQSRGFRPLLNPGPEVVVEPGDRMVLLARSYEAAGAEGVAHPLPEGTPAAVPSTEGRRRVLILGWSHKVPALVAEFASYPDERFELDVVSTIPPVRRERQVERYEVPLDRIQLRQIEADYTIRSDLERLAPAGYHNVVLMGSDWLRTGAESDARTIVGYLLLQDVLADPDRRPDVLVELLDPENVTLLGQRAGEVIISPVIVSHMLAQVALRRELRAVFEELFTAGGAEIAFRDTRHYGLDGSDVSFAEIEERAATRGEIALGVMGNTRAPTGPALQLNPPRGQALHLGPGDELVVLVSYA